MVEVLVMGKLRQISPISAACRVSCPVSIHGKGKGRREREATSWGRADLRWW